MGHCHIHKNVVMNSFIYAINLIQRIHELLRHVPWCMLGSLTRGFLWIRRRGKNVPGIPGACATLNFTYLVRGPLKSRMEMPHKRAITIYSLSQHFGTKYSKLVMGSKPVPASRPTMSCDHFYISVRSANVSDDIKNEDFMYRAALLITVTPLHVRTKYRIKFIHVASCVQCVAGIGLHWLVLINGPLRAPTTSKTPLI